MSVELPDDLFNIVKFVGESSQQSRGRRARLGANDDGWPGFQINNPAPKVII